MSSIGISSALVNLSQAASAATTARTPSTAMPVETSATLKPEVVKLSMAGQAVLMHQEGNSPGLIASSLGIQVVDVNSYLGLAVDTPAAAMPTPSGASAKSSSGPAPVALTKTVASGATVPSSPAPPVVITAANVKR